MWWNGLTSRSASMAWRFLSWHRQGSGSSHAIEHSVAQEPKISLVMNPLYHSRCFTVSSSFFINDLAWLDVFLSGMIWRTISVHFLLLSYECSTISNSYCFEISGWAEENNRVVFPYASSESKEYIKDFDFAWEWKWYDSICLPLLLLSLLIVF